MVWEDWSRRKSLLLPHANDVCSLSVCCPEASSGLGSAPRSKGTFLPPSNDVLWLCSCAGPPDGEVDKLFLNKLPGADGMRVVTVDGV